MTFRCNRNTHLCHKIRYIINLSNWYQTKALRVRMKLVLVQCSYVTHFESCNILKVVKLVAISYLSMHRGEYTSVFYLQALTPSPASFLTTAVNEFMKRLRCFWKVCPQSLLDYSKWSTAADV